jgi:D-serine deaminase-like pyridoxal phosphate-dependent protein
MALRPHAKTHKCREIARWQMTLGANGISVATLGEAEILTRSGAPAQRAGTEVDDVFIAYPIWADADSIARLRRLAERVNVTVGADSPEAVERLAPVAGAVRVMVEIDCGLKRSGVMPADAADIALTARELGVGVRGVFAFPGHGYRPGAGVHAAADEADALAKAYDALRAAGFSDVIRSGGSTPTAVHTRAGSMDELRPGVYVFNEAQQVELGVAQLDEIALVVAATVVSRPGSGRVVLDAGSKVLGPDRPAWATGHGRLLDWPEARITGLWEHHAVVEFDGSSPGIGDVVSVVPNHVCTAVNLVPELLVVEQQRIVDRWQVAARSANR